MYSISLNKLIERCLIKERSEGTKRLIDSLDHILLEWLNKLINEKDACFERYFQQIVLSLIHKSVYLLRKNEAIKAILVLKESEELCLELKNSKVPKTVNVCAQYNLTLGSAYLEANEIILALRSLFDGVKYLIREHGMITKFQQRTYETIKDLKTLYKIEDNMNLLGSSIYKIGLINSFINENTVSFDSYKMCKWITDFYKQIFPMNILNSAFKFLIESCHKEISCFQFSLENSISEESIKTTEEVIKNETSEVVIKNLWKLYNNPKVLTEENKQRNFKTILNGIKGNHTNLNKAILSKTINNHTLKSPKLYLHKSRKSDQCKFNISKNVISYMNKHKRNQSSIEKIICPNEYFKGLICNMMDINKEWLDETDPKIRIGLNEVKNIQYMERYSNKSYDILKTLLKNKKRDSSLKYNDEKKLIPSKASYEISHKIYSLRNSINSFNQVTKPKSKFRLSYCSNTNPNPKVVYKSIKMSNIAKLGEAKIDFINWHNDTKTIASTEYMKTSGPNSIHNCKSIINSSYNAPSKHRKQGSLKI